MYLILQAINFWVIDTFLMRHPEPPTELAADCENSGPYSVTWTQGAQPEQSYRGFSPLDEGSPRAGGPSAEPGIGSVHIDRRPPSGGMTQSSAQSSSFRPPTDRLDGLNGRDGVGRNQSQSGSQSGPTLQFVGSVDSPSVTGDSVPTSRNHFT